MERAPARAVIDRVPSPDTTRVRIDGSADSKCLLEAASRTPAVLEPLGFTHRMVSGIVKLPLGAQLADIGAAALRKLLGEPVSYVGPAYNQQVDTTNWRLPDRTPPPTAPAATLPSSLTGKLSAGIRAVIDDARAQGQRATDAVTAAQEAWQAARDALKHVSALEEQQQQARAREEAMRAAHAHELEQQRAGAAVSRAVLEQHLAAATTVAMKAKAVADIATKERDQQQSIGTAAANMVAQAAVVQHGQSSAWPGPHLGDPREALLGEPGHPIPMYYASDASSVRVASSDVHTMSQNKIPKGSARRFSRTYPFQVANERATHDVRQGQIQEQKNEREKLDRRDVALKKAQEELASAEARTSPHPAWLTTPHSTTPTTPHSTTPHSTEKTEARLGDPRLF